VWKYVPAAYCYYGYEPEQSFCRADSNGNAAGNTIEEAILQGFLELVERDATAIWWFNKIRHPFVKTETFGNPYFAKVRKYYHRIGRRIWALDLTHDFGVPVFAAVSRSEESQSDDYIFGFGAHLDPAVALSRAFTEMNQFLPRILRHMSPIYDARRIGFVEPDPLREKTINDFVNLSSTDLRTDIIRCVELAKRRGMETLVVDQTRSDVGLNVVKVIVPGMRHFRARFGEGRLYDVPVQLGWLKKALNEEQLNRDSFLF
jgi:ribosomal protein S12 methylthiotransferase accessory factor